MTGQPMYFYRLCGLNLASDLRLPELAGEQVRGALADTFTPDVQFILGEAAPLSEPTHSEGTWQIDGDRAFRWDVKDYGRYLMTGGNRVIIEPAEGASDLAARAVLIGPIQSILWYQRQQVALHASAVLRGGAALCISGKTGAGKSVLTALLAERGLPVLADDLCVLGGTDAANRLLPGYATLRLWDDISDQMPSIRKLEPAHINGRKSLVSFGDTPPLPTSTAISDLFLLNARGGDLAFERCTEFQLLQRCGELAHLPRAARAMGRMLSYIQQLHGLIAGGTRVWSVTLPDDLPATRAAIGPLLDALDRE
ncbi:MAG: hypothetical protein ABI673_03445 [Novosphingobium sp.]